jgi:hypothetical protein
MVGAYERMQVARGKGNARWSLSLVSDFSKLLRKGHFQRHRYATA